MKKLIPIILSALTLVSCEDIIDINLNDSDPRLVTEGFIFQDSLSIVKLVYTSNYFDSAQAIPEEDAVVMIYDDKGRSDRLLHLGNGIYKGTSIPGTENTSYSLIIESGDKVYEASSFMADKPELLKLEYELLYIPHYVDNKIYTIKTVLVDNKDEENYYMFRYYRNGEFLNSYYSTYSDQFLSADTIIYSDFRLDFYLGDTVKVDVFAIDEALYDYFNLVNDVLFSAMSSSTPYNPSSNFSNGMLGYFMAATVDSRSIIIR